MYETLRDDDPAHHVENGDYWVLSRYSDVQAAVLDTGRYSSASGLTVGYDEFAAAGLEEAVPLVMLDPPEHTEFRERIGHSYTPRRVAGIEPALRRFVRARLDAIAELGKCDIVAELFRPVPSFDPGFVSPANQKLTAGRNRPRWHRQSWRLPVGLAGP